MPEPISRQRIGYFYDSTASIILQKIAQQAETFIDVEGIFDGWTDCATRSYLGLTIHVVSKTQENNYDYHVVVIGHIPIHDVHITHEILAQIITEKFHEVNIPIPNCFVTDAYPNFEPTIKELNSEKKNVGNIY